MKLSPATPELQVRDVSAAQAYYHACRWVDVAWHSAEGRIGAVARGERTFFLRAVPDPHPGAVWIFAEEIDALRAHRTTLGAEVQNLIADMPWELCQFTLCDPGGNLLHFHHEQ